MTTDEILDQILIPRPNGSEGLEQVATFIAETLRQNGAAVTLRAFTGEGFPRRLHSEHDSRDRLSVAAIDRGTDLLHALSVRADANPELVENLGQSKGP